MTNLRDDFVDLTDDELNDLGTGVLRGLADEFLTDDSYRLETIAVFPFDDVVVNSDDALIKIGDLVGYLRRVYADRGARAVPLYDRIEVRVYAGNEALRQRLRYVRDAQRQLRDG